MQFSAHLGFLWTELSRPDAIRAAKKHGFSAVEFHWPYDTPAEDVAAALAETGLQALGINTVTGGSAEFGLAALVHRERDARAAIDQSIAYASAIGARYIHVMAGLAYGEEANYTYLANLTYAAAMAAPHGITILIEPLNQYDAPGYFLTGTRQAVTVINTVAQPNIKMLFDCYHVQIMEGDLTRRLHDLMPAIGHIQFASVPDRGPPNQGEVNYTHIFQTIADLAFTGPLGAEYKPNGPTEPTLGWLKPYTS